MIRRSISFLFAALLILAAVAGCTAPAANPQPSAAAATAAPADQGAQTGGEKKGETLKIGVVCPLSGSGAIAGKYITNGIKLIENKLTAEGGLLVGDTRYPIQFLYEDNEAKEDITANVYQKLINQDEVIAIVGPDMSKCILAAGPIAQQAGCTAIGTFTTNEAVTKVGDYIFRACFIDPFQGKVAATFAWEEGYKTAGVLYNNADAYSKGLYEAFKASYEALGGTLVEVQAYSGSDVKDYNVQLTKIAAANPECLILPNMFLEIPLQVQQARAMGLNAPIIGGDSMDAPEVAQVAGAENIKGTAYISAFSPDNPDPVAQEFVKAFTDAYGDKPNSNAVLAYEATMMVLEGIKNAKTIDRAGVRDAIAGIKDLQLPSGIITVGEDRNPIKGAAVLQYNDQGVATFLKNVNP
jgi:branched-chain amino acid transport system substrate-binding protein